MDGTFFKALEASIKSAVGILTIGERKYVPAGFTQVNTENTVTPLKVSSLDGICCFLKEEPIEDEHFLITVGPEKIEVYGSYNSDLNRNCYISATPDLPKHYNGNYRTIEDMIMYLQTAFVTSEKYPDKEVVLQLISKVTDDAKVEFEDNGLSQSVSAKTGITTKDLVSIPNKFLQLQPIYTFEEVDQPVLPFLLRGKKVGDQPMFALFTVEGSNWMVDTNNRIKEYLKKNIGKTLAAKTSKYSVI